MKAFYSRKRISIILTAIGLLFWTVGIIQSRLEIGSWGLFTSYSVFYHIGLVFNAIAAFLLWIARENHQKLLFAQTFFFITEIWLGPVIIGSNPVFASYPYIDFGMSNYINQYGQLQPSLFWYHNWPGLWITESASMIISGTNNPDSIALFSSYFIQILLLMPLYFFFKNVITEENHRWAAIWFFYLGNWTAAIYFFPQGIAMFLFVLLFALLTIVNRSTSATVIIKSVLVTASIVVTHALTSVAAFLAIFFLWISKRQKMISITLLITVALFIGTWTLYGAISQVQWHLPYYMERIFRLDLLFKSNLLETTTSSSTSHISINYLRILFSGIIGLAGGVGLIMSRWFRNQADKNMFLVMISIGLLLATALYGFEMVIRVYLLALIPLAYFAIKLFKTRITVAILFLLVVISIPLHVITQFGNAAADDIPEGEIYYWHFMLDNVSEGNITGGLNQRGLDAIGYRLVSVDDLEWYEGSYIGDKLKLSLPHYINTGKYEQAYYTYYEDRPDLVSEIQNNLENSQHYNLIYVNKDTDVFIKEE